MLFCSCNIEQKNWDNGHYKHQMREYKTIVLPDVTLIIFKCNKESYYYDYYSKQLIMRECNRIDTIHIRKKTEYNIYKH